MLIRLYLLLLYHSIKKGVIPNQTMKEKLKRASINKAYLKLNLVSQKPRNSYMMKTRIRTRSYAVSQCRLKTCNLVLPNGIPQRQVRNGRSLPLLNLSLKSLEADLGKRVLTAKAIVVDLQIEDRLPVLLQRRRSQLGNHQTQNKTRRRRIDRLIGESIDPKYRDIFILMRNSVNRQSYELLYDHLEEINIFSQEVHIRTTDRSWVQVSELEYEKLILDDRVYFGDLNNLRIIIRMDTLLNDGYGKVKDGFEHSYTNVMNLLDKNLCLIKHSRKRVLPDSRLDLISMFPIQKQGAYTHYKFNELGELRCMTTNRFNSSMNKLLRLYKGPSNNKHFRYLLYCMVKFGSNVNLIRSSIRLSKLYFCIDGRNAYTKWKSVVLNVVFSFYRRFID